MPRRSPSKRRARKAPKRRPRRARWRARLKKRLPSKRTRRRIKNRVKKRASGTWRKTPRGLRRLLTLAAILVLLVSANVLYQVIRKPSELFYPVSSSFHKAPAQTWDAYGSLFRKHATDVITADFLAALAQVEASGNPVARTYWRWAKSHNPFSIYRPASSAVGMFQITDGTFEQARRFCIHDHAVVRDGPWDDFESCWLSALYFRVIPSHAIELTSAYLDHHVQRILRRYPMRKRTKRAEHDLAAIIHLCGAGAAERVARKGHEVKPGQRCGDHDLRGYLDKVSGVQRRFVG